MSVDWSYYDKFDWIDDKYLPSCGEGETMAMQIVTAVSKLVYKWYNDGDVYDNTHYLSGWCNDLSSYANWLVKYVGYKAEPLYRIGFISTESEYEDLLKDLTDATHDEEFLKLMDKQSKIGSVYECDGPFKFVDPENDDDEDGDWWI